MAVLLSAVVPNVSEHGPLVTVSPVQPGAQAAGDEFDQLPLLHVSVTGPTAQPEGQGRLTFVPLIVP